MGFVPFLFRRVRDTPRIRYVGTADVGWGPGGVKGEKTEEVGDHGVNLLTQ